MVGNFERDEFLELFFPSDPEILSNLEHQFPDLQYEYPSLSELPVWRANNPNDYANWSRDLIEWALHYSYVYVFWKGPPDLLLPEDDDEPPYSWNTFTWIMAHDSTNPVGAMDAIVLWAQDNCSSLHNVINPIQSASVLPPADHHDIRARFDSVMSNIQEIRDARFFLLVSTLSEFDDEQKSMTLDELERNLIRYEWRHPDRINDMYEYLEYRFSPSIISREMWGIASLLQDRKTEAREYFSKYSRETKSGVDYYVDWS